MAQYNLTPVDVPWVETKYRTIKTKLPVPESLENFKKLKGFLKGIDTTIEREKDRI